MVEFGKICNIRDGMKWLPDFTVISATEKCDGCFSSLGINDSGVFEVCSRNCLIGPNERVRDNQGFWAWASTQEQHLRETFPDVAITVCGEWVGPGIQGRIHYC